MSKGPIEINWKELNNFNTQEPDIWGPSFWFMLHNGTSKYPINPSPWWKERMKQFIIGLPIMIPCEKCSDHATAYIEGNWHRLDDIVSTRNKLFIFFVDMHNIVNKRYGKPEMSYSDAFKLYNINL